MNTNSQKRNAESITLYGNLGSNPTVRTFASREVSEVFFNSELGGPDTRLVTRPGGEIVLVNHIGAESGLIAAVEGWMGRRSADLGWRPEFPWSVIGDWIARRDDIVLTERRRLAQATLTGSSTAVVIGVYVDGKRIQQLKTNFMGPQQ